MKMERSLPYYRNAPSTMYKNPMLESTRMQERKSGKSKLVPKAVNRKENEHGNKVVMENNSRLTGSKPHNKAVQGNFRKGHTKSEDTGTIRKPISSAKKERTYSGRSKLTGQKLDSTLNELDWILESEGNVFKDDKESF